MLETIDPFPGHADLADGFGSMQPPRRYPHTGLDWNRGIAGEPIPAWCAGWIERNEWSGGNGHTLSIRIDGLEDGVQLWYSAIHMADESELPVGTYVALGDTLGVVGDTGTNARGPHLHSSLSDHEDVHLGYGHLRDPWAFIQSHLTTHPNATPIEKEELDMNLIVHSNRDPQTGDTVAYPGATNEEQYPHVYLVNTATFEARHLLTIGVVQAYEKLGIQSNFYDASFLYGYSIPTPS